MSRASSSPASSSRASSSRASSSRASSSRASSFPGPRASRLRRYIRFSRRCLRRGAVVTAWGSAVAVAIGSVLWFTCPFPWERLDGWPVSPRVTTKDGQALLEVVGRDDQWRQPIPLDSMGRWVAAATVSVEDERFFSHLGVDPVAIARAVGQNVTQRRVVSGASTITMQLCRMTLDRGQPARSRSLSSKLVEAFRALQLERRFSKEEILEHYLNVAPYGGNLRGIEAAARRYFGKSTHELSLSEAALLAGLPQSPERLRPDRFPERARSRRDHVLARLLEEGHVDRSTYESARQMPVTIVRSATTEIATHAAWFAKSQRPRGGVVTIDLDLQRALVCQLPRWCDKLPSDADCAIVVIEIETGKVRSWIGSADRDDPRDGAVDGVIARRSPGSTLKPFLFGFAFDHGRLSPESLVPDEPIQRAHWNPKNFDGAFAHRVTVRDALQRSLNLPAILVTEAFGVRRFVQGLRQLGIDLPVGTSERSGLAVVTGAVEVSLLELTNAYAALGRNGEYRRCTIWEDSTSALTPDRESNSGRSVLGPIAARTINEILSNDARVATGAESLSNGTGPWFMWKTGTSSKQRDAWAVGHNGNFAVGVWVGRFSGAGHASFVGRHTAEPILVDVFCALPPMPIPSRAPEIVVSTPYRLRSTPRRMQILDPGPREVVYAAESGRAIIQLRATHAEPNYWFLNGASISGSVSAPESESAPGLRLDLQPGFYRLRCLTATGETATREFSVEFP